MICLGWRLTGEQIEGINPDGNGENKPKDQGKVKESGGFHGVGVRDEVKG
jgi:hypothetical protein